MKKAVIYRHVLSKTYRVDILLLLSQLYISLSTYLLISLSVFLFTNAHKLSGRVKTKLKKTFHSGSL